MARRKNLKSDNLRRRRRKKRRKRRKRRRRRKKRRRRRPIPMCDGLDVPGVAGCVNIGLDTES